MIGTTIGKYRIVGQLGRGGMGTVYQAVDETLDREVAIKVLNPELADAKVMKRFQKEATIVAKLNHPEIAAIYELFRSETDLLMVMELVRGETLDKISDRLGALPTERAAYLIEKILSALAHAHRAGIVHCDIKPANVMVTEDGDVKIMDFGVARVRGAVRVTADGGMMGTPAYMPPEQVLGKELDGRADLYSVGVVFYRLLTGALPFAADNAMAMLQKQISDAPPPLQAHREGLPEWCESMLQRALAKAPADRFQTAEEFREALRRATGKLATELTSGLAILADFETTTPSPAEKTQVLAPVPGDPAAVALPAASSPIDTPPHAVALPSSATAAKDSDARGTPTMLRRPFVLIGLLAVLTVGVALVAIVAPRRSAVASKTTTANGSAPAIQNAAPSPPSSATPPTTTAASQPAAPPDTRTSTPVAGARGGTRGAGDGTIPIAAARPSSVRPAGSGKTFAVPLVFDAKALMREGDRQRERDARVVLAEGTINVQANDDHKVLHAVPYDGVISISCSRGRDPMWNAPAGPTRVARAGRGVLGIFRGERHWVSLRTKDPTAPFLVLRLDNDAQARRAITALEERTGRKAELVAARKDDR